MPAGNPLIGETWSTQVGGRDVLGIIASVSEHMVTLVSLTGNRLSISPERLFESWVYTESAPITSEPCGWTGCRQPGILTYLVGIERMWGCPQHLPVGVGASLVTPSLADLGEEPLPNSPPNLEATSTNPCPYCHSITHVDPIQDVRGSTPLVPFWRCPACNTQWGVIQAGFDAPRFTQALRDFVTRLDTLRVRIGLVEIQSESTEMLQRSGYISSIPPFLIMGTYVTLVAELPQEMMARIHLEGVVTLTETRNLEHPYSVGSHLPVETFVHGDRSRNPVDPHNQGPQTGSLSPGTLRQNILIRTVGPTLPRVETSGPTLPRVETSGPELTRIQTPPLITRNSAWVQRGVGNLVYVSAIRYHQNPSADAQTTITFSRVDPSVTLGTMVETDFRQHFTPYVPTASTPGRHHDQRVIEVLAGEEWELLESGEVFTIDTVNTRANLVYVTRKNGTTVNVPYSQFANAFWRRVQRPTSFEQILNWKDD